MRYRVKLPGTQAVDEQGANGEGHGLDQSFAVGASGSLRVKADAASFGKNPPIDGRLPGAGLYDAAYDADHLGL